MRDDVVADSVRSGTLRSWVGSGFWAVLDQGLFAISNFTLNVLLARWLGPEEYGIFALVFSLFLLVGSLHSAVITEPMLVFGSGRFRGRFGSYLAVVLGGHWLVSMVAGISLVAAGAIASALGVAALGSTLLACGIASPFILFQWVTRRASYIDQRPRLAAQAGVVYLVLVIGGAIAARSLGVLGTSAALALMAGASIISGIYLLRRIRAYRPHVLIDDMTPFRREILGQHWRYGRWALGSSTLVWLSGDAVYVILTYFHGFQAAGSMRAGINLVMPVLQIVAALGTVALPAFVGARIRGNLRTAVLGATVSFGAISLLYAVVLNAFAEPIVDLLYATAYPDLASLVFLLSLLPFGTALVVVVSTVLRAMEATRSLFVANLIGAISTVAVGTVLIWRWGVAGAVGASLLASFVTVIVVAVVLLRWVRDERRRAAAERAGVCSDGVRSLHEASKTGKE